MHGCTYNSGMPPLSAVKNCPLKSVENKLPKQVSDDIEKTGGELLNAEKWGSIIYLEWAQIQAEKRLALQASLDCKLFKKNKYHKYKLSTSENGLWSE